MIMQQLLAYSLMGMIAVFIMAAIAAAWLKSKRFGIISSTIPLLLVVAISLYMFMSGMDTTILGAVHLYAFSEFFIAMFAVLVALVDLLSYGYSEGYNNLLVLLSFSFAGIVIIPAAVNVLAIFVGIELIAVSTSFMVLLSGRKHLESATKLFLLSTVSIVIFAFAMALLFPYDISLSVSEIATSHVPGGGMVLFAMLFLVVAMGFDTALFPFNLWIPDVYEGSPSHISALLAGVNKKVAFVVLLEVAFVLFPLYKSSLVPLLIVLSVATMFFGNIVAMVQDNVKRMLAYSSISQAGYILIGIAAFSASGLEASIFQMFVHAFMVIGAFAAILWLESHNIKTIEDYTGLASRSTFIAVAFTLLMLSMAGIPALAGFYGKFLLFSSAASSGLVLLAFIGVLNSFMSIYYYYRAINAMFIHREHAKLPLNKSAAIVVAICVIVIIAFGVFPQPLMSAASAAAAALYKP